MLRLFAVLLICLALSGCQSTGDTVIARSKGRDVVVTEAEIAQRAKDKGVSREVALRQLRREHDMRAAIEMQKEWKSTADVRVDGVKVRTTTDQPPAPNEEEIAEFISQAQTKRANAREALLAKEEGTTESPLEEVIDDSNEESIDRYDLPSNPPQFEARPGEEGWNQLQSRRNRPLQ
jgi:hypothetical protein